MKTNLLFYSLALIFLTSCYKYEVPLFENTKWKYTGDVIQNNIDAKITIIDFISKDSLYIYEDNILTDKAIYSFSIINRRGIVDKYNLFFERKSDDENKMIVTNKDKTFIFNIYAS